MSQERDAILNAMGGKRGLIDNGLPSVLFLIVFNIQKDLQSAIYAAVALSAVLAVLRLAKRDTLQHAISGVIGVLICAWFASRGGQAKDYYIPSFIKNSAYALVYAIGNLVGWPILGLVIGPIIGENLAWRKSPARKRVYVMAGWVWVGMFVLRVLIMYPLYQADQLNALGVASLVLGYPLFLLTIWWTWLIIKTVPSVKPDIKPE
ncbi:MAG: DUF3159 domain-containing protein [Candidatus Nanopelagicaceae bacterium]|jgi:hypothetical protein